MDIYEVHIWNPTNEVVSRISIPPSKRADIQLYDSTLSDVEMIINHFRSLGFRRFHVGSSTIWSAIVIVSILALLRD